ncbi:hypothetical protein, partial [Staphylococcus aureus]
VTPFATGVPGGIRVVAADINGDGTADLICGTGPGVQNEVVIFDGATGKKIADFSPFEASFTGGVFLSAGNLTGATGQEDLVVSPDNGGGPRV